MTEDGGRTRKLLLIRYNLAAPFSGPVQAYPGHDIHLDTDWLSRRRQLFDAYCWPSIERQTDPDFTVLVLFHKDTPAEYVSGIVSRDIRIVPLFCGDEGRESPVEFRRASINAIRQWLRSQPASQWLSTTRLDSDDALAPDYFERLSGALVRGAKNELRYFYFPEGQLYDVANDSYASWHWPKNACGTLVEPFEIENIKTVLFEKHTVMLSLPHSFAIDDEIGWCQVIHGGNVLNRMRGTALEKPKFSV